MQNTLILLTAAASAAVVLGGQFSKATPTAIAGGPPVITAALGMEFATGDTAGAIATVITMAEATGAGIGIAP